MLKPTLLATALAVTLAACAPERPMPAQTPVAPDLGAGAQRGATAPSTAAMPAMAAQSAPATASRSLPSPGVAPRATASHAGHTHRHGPSVRTSDVPGHGTVDAIDPTRRRVTVTHEAMPEIGWPKMTMVFAVPGNVELDRFKAGDHIDFTLRAGQGGSYDLIDMMASDH